MGCGDPVGTFLNLEEKEMKKKMLLKMRLREYGQILGEGKMILTMFEL